jgi:hypothetical protein
MSKGKEKKFFLLVGVSRNEVIRSQSDIKFNSLRTRQARRRLVVLWVVLFVGEMLTAFLNNSTGVFVSAAITVLLLWGYFAIRTSVRHVADTPDELLDERQIAVRDRSYLNAYRIISSIFVVASLGISLALDMGAHLKNSINWTDSTPLVSICLLVVVLPSLVLAWTDRGEEPN